MHASPPSWLSPVLIFAAVLAAFSGALFLDFAPIDDWQLIVEHPVMQMGWTEAVRWMFTHFDPELYIPVTFLSFKIDHSIVGANPFWYHFTNLLLHSCNALLVFFVTRRVTRSAHGALFAGLLFAVLPVHAEAVVWISARKDLLTTFFGTLSVLCILRVNERKAGMFICSLLFFAVALLSKISLVLLPFILFLLLRHQGIMTRNHLLRLLPFFLLSLVLGLVALLGKEAVIGSSSLLERMIFAAYAIGSGFLRIFAPIHLSPFYPIPALDASIIIVATIPFFLIISAMITRHRLPLYSLGVAWFLLGILPTVLNIQTDAHAAGATFAADRYVYFPSIGILIALIGSAEWLMRRLQLTQIRPILFIVASLLFLLCIPIARLQVQTWRTPTTLFSHVLSFAPRSLHARIALARVLREERKMQEAFNLLKEGLRFSDDARLHIEAGFLLAETAQTTEAEEQFLIARRLDPTAAEPLYGLGGLREHEGKNAEAARLYEQALELEPEYPAAKEGLQRVNDGEQ